MLTNTTVTELNERARAFWAVETALMKNRIADKVLREIAFETIDDEMIRDVPVRCRITLEAALFHAESKRNRFSSDFGLKGGKAAKADPLQKIIIDIVRLNPGIESKELLKELQHRQGDGIIDDVEETRIYFRRTGPTGVSERGQVVENKKKVISDWSPISGLKHRLTRARKKISQ